MCARAKRKNSKIPEEYEIIPEEPPKLPEEPPYYSGSLPQSRVEKSREDNPPISPLVGGRREVFVKPTAQEVEDYCRQRGNGITGGEFLDFYEAKGWMIGRNKMKDWKAAVRTWEGKRRKEKQTNYNHTDTVFS